MFKLFHLLHRSLLLTLAAGCLLIPTHVYSKGATNYNESETPIAEDSNPSIQTQTREITHIAQTATPAVVSIRVQMKGNQGQENADPNQQLNQEFFRRFFGMQQQPNQSRPHGMSQGSGFLVSADGFILTNNHIVQNTSDIFVALTDGREFPAEVVGTDPTTDLAVLKINAVNLPFLTLGDSNKLQIGEWVVAIGSPFGLNATVTVGVVSAKGRNNLNITDIEDFIQTDAAINPGNSGGPLINLQGQVIGINTAIVTGSGGYMGIGFAIPSDMASRVMHQIINTGSVTRGYIGVALQPIDNDMASSFGLEKPQGALVTEVVKNSPADKAGLEQGDIILKYNNMIVDSLNSFRKDIAMMPPGTVMNLVINRDGKTQNLKLTIGTQQPAETLGVEVETMTEQSAQSMGYPIEKGVLVKRVDPNSSAAAVGIRPGAVVLRVNRQVVTNPDEFYSALQIASKDSKKVTLLVRQGQVLRYVTLKLN
jgi:serine protease Do